MEKYIDCSFNKLYENTKHILEAFDFPDKWEIQYSLGSLCFSYRLDWSVWLIILCDKIEFRYFPNYEQKTIIQNIKNFNMQQFIKECIEEYPTITEKFHHLVYNPDGIRYQEFLTLL